LMLFTHA